MKPTPLLLLALTPLTAFAAPTITRLDVPPDYPFGGNLIHTALAPNGSTSLFTPVYQPPAPDPGGGGGGFGNFFHGIFFYTPSTGFRNYVFPYTLSLGGGGYSSPSHLSHDGTQIIGISSSFDSLHQVPIGVFRFSTLTNTHTSLPGSDYDSSRVLAATPDGTAIVRKLNQTVFWYPDNTVAPAPFSFDDFYLSVSDDLSVAVGRDRLTQTATRWTPSTGYIPLPTLPNATDTIPLATSSDGSISIGYISTPDGQYVARWSTPTTPPVPSTPTTLDLLSGPLSSLAFDQAFLTPDGSTFTLTGSYGVFYYSPSTGLLPLLDYLHALGLSDPDNLFTGAYFTSMTSDAQTFSASTHNEDEGQFSTYLITIPEPSTSLLLLSLPPLLSRRRRA